jgi:hypothetical protein
MGYHPSVSSMHSCRKGLYNSANKHVGKAKKTFERGTKKQRNLTEKWSNGLFEFNPQIAQVRPSWPKNPLRPAL